MNVMYRLIQWLAEHLISDYKFNYDTLNEAYRLNVFDFWCFFYRKYSFQLFLIYQRDIFTRFYQF